MKAREERERRVPSSTLSEILALVEASSSIAFCVCSLRSSANHLANETQLITRFASPPGQRNEEKQELRYRVTSSISSSCSVQSLDG